MTELAKDRELVEAGAQAIRDSGRLECLCGECESATAVDVLMAVDDVLAGRDSENHGPARFRTVAVGDARATLRLMNGLSYAASELALTAEQSAALKQSFSRWMESEGLILVRAR